ncbi:MAG: CDP-glycerol glycerophosphotransferase family protein [Gammaproteobacteria bacterium]|nr:CDP-glycerol glycerophosphotransferase family protein [Gammaproteobacteria bacterium]
MKIDKGNPKHWALLTLQGLFAFVAALLRPLRKNAEKPRILLYGHQFNGNLRALYLRWQDAWQDRLEMQFLCLNPSLADSLEAQGVQVLRCHRLLDMLCAGRADAIISDHGPHLLTPLLHLSSIKFIDVWHGIPFKGFIPQDFRSLHAYDEVWVPSDRMRDMYLERFGFSAHQVHSLGYARTDVLFQRPLPASDFRNTLPAAGNDKLVLYAPTWQQDERGRNLFPFGYSQSDFLDEMERICAKHNATLIVRAHQNTAIAEEQRAHVQFCSVQTYADTEDLLLGASVLICDWSSIAFDYLALNRPTIFLDVPPPFRHGFSLGPEYRFGYVASQMHSLATALEDYLANEETYLEVFGKRHAEVTDELYSSSSRGRAAEIQLERLELLLAH